MMRISDLRDTNIDEAVDNHLVQRLIGQYRTLQSLIDGFEGIQSTGPLRGVLCHDSQRLRREDEYIHRHDAASAAASADASAAAAGDVCIGGGRLRL